MVSGSMSANRMLALSLRVFSAEESEWLITA